MPHYAVNIRSPDKAIEAVEGDNYADLQSVRDFAVDAVKEILEEMFELELPLRFCELDVVDDEGIVKLIVPFSALLH